MRRILTNLRAVSRSLPDRSKRVIVRFGLKLAVFSVTCGFQMASGGPNLFFDLTFMAAILSIVLAVHAREHPMGNSLSHWDEALVFGWISLIDDILGLG
jgi:hypothetical protein